MVEELPRFKTNAFLISFENDEDKAMVLDRCPWSIFGELFAIEDWSFSIAVNGLRFDKSLFWVRAVGIPPDFLSVANAEVIAKRTGELLILDLNLKRDR